MKCFPLKMMKTLKQDGGEVNSNSSSGSPFFIVIVLTYQHLPLYILNNVGKKRSNHSSKFFFLTAPPKTQVLGFYSFPQGF